MVVAVFIKRLIIHYLYLKVLKNSDGIFKDFYGCILRLDVPRCKLGCISKDQILPTYILGTGNF